MGVAEQALGTLSIMRVAAAATAQQQQKHLRKKDQSRLWLS